MKLIALVALSFFAVSDGIAQPGQIVNSYSYLQSGEFDKAKDAADKAVTHPKTEGSAKAWKYRGDIYFSIYTSVKEEVNDLSENANVESFNSYKKAIELDTKYGYKDQCSRNIALLQNYSLNNGVVDYNDKNYEQALKEFQITVEIGEYRGMTDSLAVYNCGLAAERAGKHKEAIGYYERCIKLGYNPQPIYSFIMHLQRLDGKTEEFESTLNQALKEYPEEFDFLTKKINLLLSKGDVTGALDYTDKAIVQDPQNKMLHFTKGTLLESLGRKNEAKASYNKSLAIDPNFFDANYNLGAFFFNQGVDINNLANEESDDAKQSEMIKEADSKFEQALKYLEKAHDINPKDSNTMQSLLQIYARLNMTEKYNEISEKLSN